MGEGWDPRHSEAAHPEELTVAADDPCKFIKRCPMFPRFASGGMLRVYQIHYCEGTFSECARYRLASQGQMPRPDLLPDGGRLREPAQRADKPAPTKTPTE